MALFIKTMVKNKILFKYYRATSSKVNDDIFFG